MKVVSDDGDSVTYVVQDRSGQYALSEEQLDDLNDILGQDAVESITFEETKISFDRVVLSKPEVASRVEAALENVITSLLEEEVISGEEADALIRAESKTSLVPGTVERAAMITGNDQRKLGDFLDVLGSCVCDYVK